MLASVNELSDVIVEVWNMPNMWTSKQSNAHSQMKRWTFIGWSRFLYYLFTIFLSFVALGSNRFLQGKTKCHEGWNLLGSLKFLRSRWSVSCLYNLLAHNVKTSFIQMITYTADYIHWLKMDTNELRIILLEEYIKRDFLEKLR